MKIIERNMEFGKMLDLYGKTAVITGGAVNIGRAVSLRFATLGVKVIIVYNSSSSEATELSKEINFVGGTAATFQADIGNEDEVESLFAGIENDDRFGRVDIMINNSGVFSISEQTDLSAEEWQRMFNINSLGTFLCSREAAKLMKRQKLLPGSNQRGVILNVASINALHPGFGGTVHYDAT
jgi:NAD(P)-dependent dehydrogenase (short-subunit alcohol dehydrogenase family)